jgi:ABC-type multidrug transport system fused ATPase/permease subunit
MVDKIKDFLYALQVKKFFLIFMLILSAISASAFMIVESAEFYNSFYKIKHGSLLNKGMWLSLTVEYFLAIMAATYITKENGKFHLMNIPIKFAMILLFILIVGAASLNVIYPKMNSFKTQVSANRNVVNQTKGEIVENNKTIADYRAKGHENSLALALAHGRKLSSKLEKYQGLLSKEKPKTTATWFDWIEIGFLILIRLVIQFANFLSVWIAGWLYRKKDKNEIIKEEEVEAIEGLDQSRSGDQEPELRLVENKKSEAQYIEVIENGNKVLRKISNN